MQMLPRLQAEESLRQVHVLSVASPYAKPQVYLRAMSKWQQTASGDREVRSYRVSEMSPATERRAFAQMGFKIQTVTPN